MCWSGGYTLLTTRPRGYCLEMICADFLAGAHLEGGNPRIPAVFHAPPLPLSAGCAETGILAAGNRRPRETSPAKRRRIRLDADAYRRLHQDILERGGWRGKLTAPCVVR